MSPLTKFIVAMLASDPATAARADQARLATKYGISVDHAAGLLRLWGGL